MNVIASETVQVYHNWFLSLLETGASTQDAVFVLTNVRDTCVQGALSYGRVRAVRLGTTAHLRMGCVVYIHISIPLPHPRL